MVLVIGIVIAAGSLIIADGLDEGACRADNGRDTGRFRAYWRGFPGSNKRGEYSRWRPDELLPGLMRVAMKLRKCIP